MVTFDAKDDMSKQISDIKDMLLQHVNVLVVAARCTKGVVGMVRDAACDHVPVIIVDRSISLSAPVPVPP